MSANALTVLETVAAIRAVLTVAKAVQEAKPDFTAEDVAGAIGAAVRMKRDRLALKGISKLTPIQVVNLKALNDAEAVLPDVRLILERARDNTAEEIAEALEVKANKAAKAKLAREKSAAAKKAETPVVAKTEDMFAKA